MATSEAVAHKAAPSEAMAQHVAATEMAASKAMTFEIAPASKVAPHMLVRRPGGHADGPGDQHAGKNRSHRAAGEAIGMFAHITCIRCSSQQSSP